MKFVMILFVLCILSLAIPAGAQTIGGDQGWYVVHANVDGASVYFDNDLKGTISAGTLTVPVFTTGTPYRTYTVSMEGYTTFTGSLDRFPGKGDSIDLYATLQAATPSPGPIGGDQGWYVVHANVNGAQVFFDNELKGTITGGTLTVPVFTTGTPYRSFAVSLTGYTTYSAPVTSYPGKGDTIDLYATLNPVQTQAPPAPTRSPPETGVVIGAFVIVGALVARAGKTS